MNINLVASKEAVDIRLFFENLIKPGVYMSLVEEFGSHEALADAIRESKKVHIYDAKGFPCFTPSGVEAYLNFAKEAAEFTKASELIELFDQLFKTKKIQELQETLEVYRNLPFVSEACLLHSLICAMHRNFKIKEEEDKPQIINKKGIQDCLDVLFGSEQIKNKKLGSDVVSEVVNYKFIRDEVFGSDENIDKYLKSSLNLLNEDHSESLIRTRKMLKRSEQKSDQK
jgi:hypothetical protein